MEPNETVLSSYYHPHQSQPPHNHSPTAAASPPNGILSNSERTVPPMVYPHSVSSTFTPPSDVASRRKRGRPRKYETPEQAAAARRAAVSQLKKVRSLVAGDSFSPSRPSASSKITHVAAFGNGGQGFTPHIISVAAGEDVYQKIMLFMQQSKREICILSASGPISSPFLRQPASSGGNVTYEGRFDILSLSGSYIRTELGGRTGGLSVCLSNADGQIIGGGIGGPLRAAGPVEVIVGTFVIDTKKDAVAGAKGMEQLI